METRRAPRLNIDIKISCKVDEESRHKFRLICGWSFTVDALDISEFGIGFLSKYFLPKRLILELKIDGAPFGLKEIMKIKGEICYCNYIKNLGYRCGVRFLNISDIYRKAIVQFISSHERRKEPRLKVAD